MLLLPVLTVTVLAADQDKDPFAIVEIGGAGEWSTGGSSYGPNIATEFDVIKEWLEIEGGFTPLFARGSAPEWSTDLIFKKPFTLSETVEFMVGGGPEWTYANGAVKTAAEFALDFMFWPWPDRRIGWYFEPTYSYSLSAGHEQSLSVSIGLLIPIP